MTKQEIKALISNNRLKEAISILLKVTEQDANSHLHSQVIAISAKFHSHKKRDLEGLLSHQEGGQDTSKIVVGLLYIVDEIWKNGDVEVPVAGQVPKSAPMPFFTSKYLIWLGGGLTMIAFLFNLTSGSGNSSIKTIAPYEHSTTNTIFEVDGTYNGGTAMIGRKGDNLTVKLHDNRPIAEGRILSIHKIIVDFSDHHGQTGKLVAPNQIRWNDGTEWVKDKTP